MLLEKAKKKKKNSKQRHLIGKKVGVWQIKGYIPMSGHKWPCERKAKNITTPLCPCLWRLCGNSLSGCHSEHPESEPGAPVWRTAHTADHPRRVLNCAPSSQSWGCWSGRRRHILGLSCSRLLVPWEVGVPPVPRHPPPSRPSQRSWYLWAGCRSPDGLGSRCAFQLSCLLVFASPDLDPPRWCRNGNMSGTLLAADERRLCHFRPGARRCLPDSYLVDGAFQLSLGFC